MCIDEDGITYTWSKILKMFFHFFALTIEKIHNVDIIKMKNAYWKCKKHLVLCSTNKDYYLAMDHMKDYLNIFANILLRK